MNFRQLSCFVAVGEEGSVTKAASRLHIAQPALTRQLKNLEGRLGVQLLERCGRGIALTTEGRRFLERVQPLLADLRAAEQDLASGATHDPEPARFGIPSALAALVHPLIQQAQEQSPAIRLDVVDGWSRFILGWIEDDALDFGLIYDHSDCPATLESRPLFDEDHYVVTRREYLASHRTISLTETLQLPLVLPTPRHGLRRAVEAAATTRGIALAPVDEVDSVPTIKQMVAAGRGVTILSGSEVATSLSPALRALPLSGPPLLRTVSLVRKPANPRRAAYDFVAGTFADTVATAIRRAIDERLGTTGGGEPHLGTGPYAPARPLTDLWPQAMAPK